MVLAAARKTDIETIMKLILQAKQFLKECGVDQWQDDYPNDRCILQDIEEEKGYLLVEENQIVGYLCVDFNGEPAYEGLEGSWIGEPPYAALHRLAIDNTYKGKGLSFQVFQLVEELCKEKSIHSIRVDTDSDNKVMKHVIEQSGFVFCGTVRYDDSPKIAYEKLLSLGAGKA